jgi:hypothetical protein
MASKVTSPFTAEIELSPRKSCAARAAAEHFKHVE